MRIANYFSLSCAALCCSNNYYVLRIALWNGYVTDGLIAVAGRSKTWDNDCMFAWNCGFRIKPSIVHPFLSLVSVVRCLVGIPASDWSSVRRSTTEWESSECDLEESWYEAWTELSTEAPQTGEKIYLTISVSW